MNRAHVPGRRGGARRPGTDPGLDPGDHISDGPWPEAYSPVRRRLGQNLTELRLAAASPRLEIADAMGSNYSRIRYMEIGRWELSVPNAVRLAVHFGVSIERLTAGVSWAPGEPSADGPLTVGHFLVESPQEAAAARMRPAVAITDRAELPPLIGAAIRDARRRRRLPQHALGLKQSHVSRFERGLEEPTLGTLIGIARVLEVSVESLLGGAAWHPGVKRPHGTALRRSAEAHRVAAPHPSPRGPAEGDRYLSERQVEALVGGTVRGLREAAGLRRREFGGLVGATEWMVGKVERDGLHRLSALIRWATVLRVPPALLTAAVTWDPRHGQFVSLGEPRRIGERPEARVGVNAREIRRRQGLSMEVVARRVGGHRTHFQMIELGARIPRPFTVLKLASALGVGPDVLCEGIGDWLVRPLPPPEVEEVELPGLVADRQRRALRLWASGATLEEIGREIELAGSGAFEIFDRLREIGVPVPYRQRPASPAQLSARLRRRRAGRRTPLALPPGRS